MITRDHKDDNDQDYQGGGRAHPPPPPPPPVPLLNTPLGMQCFHYPVMFIAR